MVAALAGRELGEAVNRKRAQRVMREHRLLQRTGNSYHDLESQAFIESWFGQFKQRCAWRAEWETIEQARAEIGDYIQRYHQRPHSGVGYRTPTEVAAAWRPDPEAEDLQTMGDLNRK